MKYLKRPFKNTKQSTKTLSYLQTFDGETELMTKMLYYYTYSDFEKIANVRTQIHTHMHTKKINEKNIFHR